MKPVLLGGTDRNDDPGITSNGVVYLGPGKRRDLAPPVC
jgi:hypothetical protein